jgi:hypothetical protein
MPKPYRKTCLLRKPVEWYSSFAMSIGVILLWWQPEWFLLSLSTSGTTTELMQTKLLLSSVMLILGSYRFYQGLHVVRYQQGLIRELSLQPSSASIPLKPHSLYLGRGFHWQALHTQRLRELDKAENQPYRCEASVNGEPALHGVGMGETDIFMDLQERAGHMLVVGTTGVGKTRLSELLITQDIHRGDVVIVIDPKGDIELLQRMMTEAQRAGRQSAMLVFHLGFPQYSARYNPIGRFSRTTEVANRVANQLPASGDSAAFKEFGWQFINLVTQVLIALGEQPNYGLLHRYIHNIPALAEKYLSQLLPLQESHYKQWVDRFVHTYRRKHEDTAPLPVEAMVAYVKAHHKKYKDKLIASLLNAFDYEKTYYDKITASLGPLLSKLTSTDIGQLLSPSSSSTPTHNQHNQHKQYKQNSDKDNDNNNSNDLRPNFDWQQVIQNKHIVYVGLDALSDSAVATAVGNAMLADLTALAGKLYKQQYLTPSQSQADKQTQTKKEKAKPTPSKEKLPATPITPTSTPTPTIINLHVDEASDIMGEEFVPLLNKSRGAGFRVTVYTQTIADIQAKLHSDAKAKQVLGNLGTVIMLRVTDINTAETLLAQLPRVPIEDVTQLSSVNDTPTAEDGVFFNSHNEDRISIKEMPMLNPNDLLSLPPGQAFALLKGGKLFKLRFPILLDDRHNRAGVKRSNHSDTHHDNYDDDKNCNIEKNTDSDKTKTKIKVKTKSKHTANIPRMNDANQLLREVLFWQHVPALLEDAGYLYCSRYLPQPHAALWLMGYKCYDFYHRPPVQPQANNDSA